MKYLGVVLVLLAAMFWGFSGGISNLLMNKGWHPLVVSFYRGFIGLIFFLIWYLSHFKQNTIKSVRFYFWAILAGIGVAGNFTFYLLSIQTTSISVAATLMYTAPLFVFIILLILRLEHSTWFKWRCIFGVILGIILLTGAYNIDTLSASYFGILTGLTSALAYALFIFSFKNASTIGNTKATLTIAFLSFCIIMILLMDKPEAITVLTSSDIGWFLLLGVIGAGVSFTIYLIGLQSTPATTASIIAMVEPVTASLFGVFVFENYLSIVQLIGMVIILVTVTLLSVKQAK